MEERDSGQVGPHRSRLPRKRIARAGSHSTKADIHFHLATSSGMSGVRKLSEVKLLLTPDTANLSDSDTGSLVENRWGGTKYFPLPHLAR